MIRDLEKLAHPQVASSAAKPCFVSGWHAGSRPGEGCHLFVEKDAAV